MQSYVYTTNSYDMYLLVYYSVNVIACDKFCFLFSKCKLGSWQKLLLVNWYFHKIFQIVAY